jgi:hypothetical protein
MRLPDGHPSAAVRQAASGCHYTRSHLLYDKVSPVSRESSLEQERALVHRATFARPIVKLSM